MNTLPPIGCNGRGVQASSLAQPVSLTEPSIEEQFRLVSEAGVFDHFDRLPLDDDEARRYRASSERHDLPVHTTSWFYAAGRDEALLKPKMALAAAVGAKAHNIMLYWHDADGRPITDQEVAAFYLRAYDAGIAHDVEPMLEYHVNMWSEDPRRVATVAGLVRDRGVPFWFTLDYSHGIFKIGDTYEQQICGIADDVATGRVVLDPRLPGSFVDVWLDMGIVRWVQVRSVAPSGPRNIWSLSDDGRPIAAVPAHSIYPYAAGKPGRAILYPFTEPAHGEWHSPWHDKALDCTRVYVRKALQHHHDHADSPLRWITTEMITLPDYAHNARFSLIGQNAAVATYLRKTWDEICSEGATPAA